MQSASKDDYVSCPYNASHRLLRKRLPMHLEKCRRNHPSQKLVVCPFNVTHVMKGSEMEEHLTVCESQSSFEKFEKIEDSGKNPIPPHLPVIECSENWDNEPDVATYNPKEYCAKNLIVRNLQGASPAVRKQFRKKERLRLIGLESDQNKM